MIRQAVRWWWWGLLGDTPLPTMLSISGNILHRKQIKNILVNWSIRPLRGYSYTVPRLLSSIIMDCILYWKWCTIPVASKQSLIKSNHQLYSLPQVMYQICSPLSSPNTECIPYILQEKWWPTSHLVYQLLFTKHIYRWHFHTNNIQISLFIGRPAQALASPEGIPKKGGR